MKTFNTLVLAGAASLSLSACGAIKDAIDSIHISERNGHYHAIVTPDLSSTNTQKVTLKLNGKEYRAGNEIDIVTLPQNTVTNQKFEKTGEVVKDGRSVQFKEAGTARIYKNNYSVVLATHVESVAGAETGTKAGSTKVLAVQGIAADLDKVKAQKGKFDYDGLAFTGQGEQGRLSYTVDFDRDVGSGYIKGIKSTGTIQLNSSSISSFKPDNSFNAKAGIKGVAVAEKDKVVGSYQLGFFGKKGNETDEIAGKANFMIGGKEADVGFGGRKQPSLVK